MFPSFARVTGESASTISVYRKSGLTHKVPLHFGRYAAKKRGFPLYAKYALFSNR
jgi:hypothetical protein